MNDSSPDRTTARSVVACNSGCRFAEPLRQQPDWIWCHHPRATSRVRSTSHECPWFVPTTPGMHPNPSR